MVDDVILGICFDTGLSRIPKSSHFGIPPAFLMGCVFTKEHPPAGANKHTPSQGKDLVHKNKKKRFHINEEFINRLSFKQYDLPNTEKAYNECICMPHWVLLGSKNDMICIISAFEKIKKYVSR